MPINSTSTMDAVDPEFILDEDPEPMATRDQVRQLQHQLNQQAELLRQANERADANMRALEDFKDQVVQVGGDYAERHDWCSTYDEILSDLGLPRRKREITVPVYVRFRAEVTVLASDEDEAYELADNLTTVHFWNPSSPFADFGIGRPYEVTFSTDADAL